MSRTPDTISTLRDVLGHCRTIAVVGLSPQWHRPSYFAAKYMQSHGYRIIPVNPLVAREDGSILGERCFASVVEAAQAIAQQGGRIDLVDCFRKSDDIPPLAEEAAEGAEAAGLQVIQNRCVKIEHARLFGGLGWAGVNTRVISAKRPQQLPY